MAKLEAELEIFPKLTITEETAETCTWLLSQYLEAHPDKTIRVTTEPGGDAFQRKVQIVPEWEKDGETVPCSQCFYGRKTDQMVCRNIQSENYGRVIRDGTACEKGVNCKREEPTHTCGECKHRIGGVCQNKESRYFDCITGDLDPACEEFEEIQ